LSTLENFGQDDRMFRIYRRKLTTDYPDGHR